MTNWNEIEGELMFGVMEDYLREAGDKTVFVAEEDRVEHMKRMWGHWEKLKSFLKETVEKRDEYWKSQEMGKATDCAEHCEKAERRGAERAVEYIRSRISTKYIAGDSFDLLGESDWHEMLSMALNIDQTNTLEAAKQVTD